MQVQALDGRTWTVRRRWLPRWHGRGLERLRKRRRERTGDDHGWGNWIDVPFDFDEGIAGFVIGIAIVVALVVLVLWGIPLLLALVDLVLVLLALLLGLIARVVFRRPWTVEAVSGEERHTRPVVGWFASGRAAQAWAEELRHGLGQQGGAHGAGPLTQVRPDDVDGGPVLG